jgi:hypothetical protein
VEANEGKSPEKYRAVMKTAKEAQSGISGSLCNIMVHGHFRNYMVRGPSLLKLRMSSFCCLQPKLLSSSVQGLRFDYQHNVVQETINSFDINSFRKPKSF